VRVCRPCAVHVASPHGSGVLSSRVHRRVPSHVVGASASSIYRALHPGRVCSLAAGPAGPRVGARRSRGLLSRMQGIHLARPHAKVARPSPSRPLAPVSFRACVVLRLGKDQAAPASQSAAVTIARRHPSSSDQLRGHSSPFLQPPGVLPGPHRLAIWPLSLAVRAQATAFPCAPPRGPPAAPPAGPCTPTAPGGPTGAPRALTRTPPPLLRPPELAPAPSRVWMQWLQSFQGNLCKGRAYV
jgi:hypothetical protein